MLRLWYTMNGGSFLTQKDKLIKRLKAKPKDFTFEEVEVHVLGYNIDFKSDKIVSYEEHVKSERMKEINRNFEYFKSIGINLTEDDVFKYRDGEIVPNPFE